MNIENKIHVPVMPNEILEYLDLKEGGVYIDCTFGRGGHSQLILKRLKKGRLIAFEWDKKFSDLAQKEISFNSPSFQIINDNFANLENCLKELGIKEVDGFLFDLGLSSDQLNEEDRGFSYRLNSPLDMRINKENNLTAEAIINNYPYEKLADIFYYYGEERKARTIAHKICYWREKERIVNSEQLIGIVASCFPRKGNKHPARKTFQSLRIFVNNELNNLSQALESALSLLAVGGKVIVISFHSLEDRIVKQMFKKISENDFEIITKKPLVPTSQEILSNNRARSAKMRVIVRKNK
ncbi:MAG: Ribosomal RNA small subunit methyltransferase H [Mycoplasmataceae bacterium]|nr:MAG: Ribosomal RNA small subunit methyltransferase H [Mycoplasmataceae bacterium]